MWTIEQKNWQVGQIENYEDNSEEMLNIFDGNPQTYIDWATEYFEESYVESRIPLDTATKIYRTNQIEIINKTDLNKKQLEADLNEIGYPYDFN
ncbi:MAG: hypothetical protein IPN94_08085 [Sphingobacteriales bacterium]|nr:hypothetical protein [Sphingobacteriales bacterium]